MKITRAFPALTQHPRCYMTLTEAESAALPKQHMESGKSLAPGHAGTFVFYTEGEVRGYVVEVRYDTGLSDLFLLPCSVTPTVGIDGYDGMLIEDAEALSLNERLNWKSGRLDIFRDQSAMNTLDYLKARGFASDFKAGAADANALRAAEVDALYAEAVKIVMPFVSATGPAPLDIGKKQAEALERAVVLFSRVVAASPKNASAYWFRGKAQQLLRRRDIALGEFIKAAECEPSQNQFSVDAAGVAIQLGRASEAVRFAGLAMRQSPNDPELISNFAVALLISGEAQEAASFGRQALKMRPSQPSIRRISDICSAVAAKKYPYPRNEAELIRIAKALRM